MTKYNVRQFGCELALTPPIYDKDGNIDRPILISGFGEPIDISNRADAVKALYDFHQTRDYLKNGDVFHWNHESKPFAKVQGIHVLPLFEAKYKITTEGFDTFSEFSKMGEYLNQSGIAILRAL